MSKAQVRQTMKDLFVRTEPSAYDATGHDWLLGIKAWAERDLDAAITGLHQGALRRERHEDYGSVEQMRFCIDVLEVFGPRGLTF